MRYYIGRYSMLLMNVVALVKVCVLYVCVGVDWGFECALQMLGRVVKFIRKDILE